MSDELFTTQDLTRCLSVISRLVESGGPDREDDPLLIESVARIHAARKHGVLGDAHISTIRDAFGCTLGPATMQGRCLAKRHGYAGDFEIIDEIYQETTTSDPRLRRWDEFFHRHGAAKAVRNRKRFFHSLLETSLSERKGIGEFHVLDLASGPCRDVAEFLASHPDAPARFTCVDQDANAIAHARQLCSAWLDRIDFVHANAFRFRARGGFDLVWSAGLFDYFDDRRFQLLLMRMLGLCAPGGQVVIGNFGDSPSMACQEIMCDWLLTYRTQDKLLELARGCGIAPERCSVESEEEGINLFLRVRAH